jgi:FkbH-like protein
VSQLTLRTNQFNLTTARLQPAQVRELMTDPAAQVLAIYASDMFGDSGLVGAVFTRRDADVVQIVNFVLSCRVFSRGIEQACLASVLADARAAGASAVLAGFRPSKKNAKVRDFYPDNGFVLVSSDPRETVYRHDLAAIGAVDHIELIRDREEDRW